MLQCSNGQLSARALAHQLPCRISDDELAVIEGDVAEAFHPEGTAEPSGLACLVVIARQQGLDLSVSQLIQDNLLPNQEVSIPELIKVARSAGMKAELVKLDWSSLVNLK